MVMVMIRGEPVYYLLSQFKKLYGNTRDNLVTFLEDPTPPTTPYNM